MDQAVAKKELQELIKREDLGNKVCIDCSNPNPQWASLSFAVFMCLQCAGVHRGLGVHISFVRSVSMDTWQEEQIRRMKLGGNAPFREFVKSYSPSESGGYRDGMGIQEKYQCWAAAQYKEKLDCELSGKPWSPSLPPLSFSSPQSGSTSPARPSSAQGLRKSRASARSATGSSLRQNSASPASFTNSPGGSTSFSSSVGGSPSPDAQKTANETYFASLGSLNASRPADLPPSQGGRYQGFGSNTPAPPASSQHPSYGLSSAAVPSISELQEHPTAALSKGWSFFSSAIVGATRTVTENVIQPGLERVRDPDFQASLKGYVDKAGKRVTAVGATANQWSKQQLGVDVADKVGGLYDNVKERVVGPGHEGYGALATSHDGDDWNRYDNEEDNFFEDFSSEKQTVTQGKAIATMEGSSSTTSAPTASISSNKKADDWDAWKDF
ncbi:GCS1 [Sanghuangporus sanghuang]